MKFEIIEKEVFDNSTKDEFGFYNVAGISVGVRINVEGTEFFIDFQTSETQDYGAISSDLAPNSANDDYDALEKIIGDDNAFHELVEGVKQAANVQHLWASYINERYIVDDGHFGGMDANSEVNRMVLRSEYDDRLEKFDGDVDRLFQMIDKKNTDTDE